MKVNYRQVCVLTLLGMIALKFLGLPSFLYVDAGTSSIFIALILMCIDAVFAFLILSLIEKSGQPNIYEFLKYCVGRVGAKIILAILVGFFVIVLSNISKGFELFIVENLYKELNWGIYALPLMILIAFMLYNGIRNIARVGELFCWLILAGILYIGLKSIGEIELDSLLPFFKDGVEPFFMTAIKHMAWFGSPTFLLMLFGKIDFRDKNKSKLFGYLFASIVLVLFMYIVFYCLFQITSPTHNFLLSDISQFSTEHSSIDELSWLIVSLWIIAQAIQLALYSYGLQQCLKYLFNIEYDFISILIVIIYILVWSLLGENVISLEQIMFTPYVYISQISSAYVIPLLLFIIYHIKQTIQSHKSVSSTKQNKKFAIKLDTDKRGAV